MNQNQLDSQKAPQNAIEVINASVELGGRTILEDIDFTVKYGDFVGLIGPNGAGKTVLLRLILGLISPTSGSVSLLGETPRLSRSRVGYVPQFANFDRRFPITALDVVLMGILGPRGAWARPHKQDRERAAQMLSQVSLDYAKDRQIGLLSGGELQRVLIARALSNNPQLVILDEPTASLDAKVGTDLYALLSELAETKTILLVSHDIGVLSSHVKTIACLNRTLHAHAHSEITGDMVQATYGCPVELIAHGLPHRVLANHVNKGQSVTVAPCEPVTHPLTKCDHEH